MSGQLDAEAQRIVDGVSLRSLEARDGKIQLTLEGAREIAAVWCQTARTMLADAPNYAETSVEFGDTPGERFASTIQRVGKLTPHEARQGAEKRAVRAEGLLGELFLRLQQCARPDGSWPGADAAEIARQILVKAGYDCE